MPSGDWTESPHRPHDQGQHREGGQRDRPRPVHRTPRAEGALLRGQFHRNVDWLFLTAPVGHKHLFLRQSERLHNFFPYASTDTLTHTPHTHTHMCARTLTHTTHIHTHMCTHTHTHVRARTHTHMCAHTPCTQSKSPSPRARETPGERAAGDPSAEPGLTPGLSFLGDSPPTQSGVLTQIHRLPQPTLGGCSIDLH